MHICHSLPAAFVSHPDLELESPCESLLECVVIPEGLQMWRCRDWAEQGFGEPASTNPWFSWQAAFPAPIPSWNSLPFLLLLFFFFLEKQQTLYKDFRKWSEIYILQKNRKNHYQITVGPNLCRQPLSLFGCIPFSLRFAHGSALHTILHLALKNRGLIALVLGTQVFADNV